jgi:hypothetical protein
MLIISEKFGRLGNNIYQLLNILKNADVNNSEININKLELDALININKIQESFKQKCDNIISNFMPKDLHLDQKRDINISSFFEIAKKYILPNLNINTQPLNSKICCIHIRSGDIFSEQGCMNPDYIQPPLAYYKKIISDLEDEYDKFILVTESDQKNQCIKSLLNWNPKIELHSKDKIQDYSILMRSQTLILSRSSFSDTVVFLSQNIKNVYFWNYNHCFSDEKQLPTRINFHPYILKDNYIAMGNWKNNLQQLELIKNYPVSKVEKQKCLIIFTTCKPFQGDDAWKQDQAIKSWTQLNGIRKKIIIIGNDIGIKEVSQKYNLIHCPNVKTLENIPFLDSMFEIANSYADNNDYMMWCNSDIIFFNDLIKNIKKFDELRISNKVHFKNFLLTGQRYDWHNPKIINNLNKETFMENMNSKNMRSTSVQQLDSQKYECSLHLPCGIDYLIHSKTSLKNKFDKKLVIAGQRHDMILFGIGINNDYFTCDISKTNFIIHQNHGEFRKKIEVLVKNNSFCEGIQMGMETSLFESQYCNNKIKFNYKTK